MDVQVIDTDTEGSTVRLGIDVNASDLGTLRLAFEKFTEDSQEQARLAEIDRPTGEQQLAYRRAADGVAGDLQSLGNLLLPVAKALAKLPEGEADPEPEQEETPSPEAEAEVEAGEADAEADADTEAEPAGDEETGPASFVAGKGDAYDYIPAWMEIPKLYSAEGTDDPLAVIKLFTPDSSWTWFLIEYDPDEDLAFGLAVGFETELGYISIAELREAKGPLGLKIERDVWWRPRPITQVQEYVAEWGEHGGPYKGGRAVAEVEVEAESEVLTVVEAIAAAEMVRVGDGIDAALEKAESVRIPERETSPLPDPWTIEDVRFLLVKLEEGPVLVADSELGIPTIHSVKGEVEHLGFGLMHVQTQSYTVDYDAGGAMQQTPSGQSWTFVRVKEGTFPYDFDDERSKLWLYLISAATDGEGEPGSYASEKAGAPEKTPAPVEPQPWQMTQRQYQEAKAVRVAGGVPILNVADADEHRQLVEEALERGEIVPTHVFEDYADLWRPWTWTLETWLQMEHIIQRTGPDMRYHAPTGKKTLWPGTTSREEVKRKQHGYEVRAALAEGEHVPGFVLAGYPELETEQEAAEAEAGKATRAAGEPVETAEQETKAQPSGGDGKRKSEPRLPDGFPATVEVDLGHTRGWVQAEVVKVTESWLYYRLVGGDNGADKVRLIAEDILWRKVAQVA